MTRLVVLDRDGVINHDSDHFIRSVDEWRPIAGSAAAIGRLTEAGYTVAVATNQSGIGRGFLSREELNELFSATSNLKHRVIFKTIYSAGLRLSEAANLKLHHIESDSMRVRVEQGKGKKDRYTLLSETVLVELRDYWHTCRPTDWLFFGQDKSRPISVSTIQVAFRAAKKKPA